MCCYPPSAACAHTSLPLHRLARSLICSLGLHRSHGPLPKVSPADNRPGIAGTGTPGTPHPPRAPLVLRAARPLRQRGVAARPARPARPAFGGAISGARRGGLAKGRLMRPIFLDLFSGLCSQDSVLRTYSAMGALAGEGQVPSFFGPSDPAA